jgi:hypothetical protein
MLARAGGFYRGLAQPRERETGDRSSDPPLSLLSDCRYATAIDGDGRTSQRRPHDPLRTADADARWIFLGLERVGIAYASTKPTPRSVDHVQVVSLKGSRKRSFQLARQGPERHDFPSVHSDLLKAPLSFKAVKTLKKNERFVGRESHRHFVPWSPLS